MGMIMNSARTAFTSMLLALAREDQTLYAVATDSRGSVTLTDFAAELPNQFVECGIAEQNAIGISAGLANGGLRPFVCGPACFYSLRSAEQVKVDVGYSQMNVKIVGVSGGISYGALGATHHATQDIALMRAVAGLEIFLPSDAPQMAAMTRYLAASDAPAYIRMGRGAVPTIYQENAPFIPGKANCLNKGKDAAIIACGEMVYPALQAAAILAQEGLYVSVYDMHTLRPLDEEAILKAAETGFVVTAEEHSIHGGLGGAVAELLSQKRPTRMRILGLPDEKLYNGNSAQVLTHYGLTADGIAQTLRLER
ncbi:MAG: transketolase family protein [Clostridiales bacterium]|nr:transketolase family protein [Clostridiales bacterium]